MKYSRINLMLACISGFLLSALPAFSQDSKIKFGKGVYVAAKDSSMDVKFSLRFQTLFEGSQTLSDGKFADDFESNLIIRRARLKFDGFVYSPKLVYKVELGISNRDIGLGKVGSENNNFSAGSSIILDAVLKWNFAKNTEVWVGQTKLPSNRERVISSQQLQQVDRSIVNNRFNLDRDIGLQLHHNFSIGNAKFREVLAVSMGEGRNVTSANDDGFSYVGRLEFMPMGAFTNKGDYFAADLEREATPKLSIGVTYEFNDDAKRSGGQLGTFLAESRDLQSLHADLMFKWKGFSLMSEYAQRSTDDPVVSYDSITDRYSAFYTGYGFNVQAGYLFKKNVEVSGRYSTTVPTKNIGQVTETQYTLGISKYIVGHSLKIQSDISLLEAEGTSDKNLMYRFQVEMAF